MKSFKTESKKVLDLMINSIYTHKEIFLRELLSNCSDAIDKLHYKSLAENLSEISRGDFKIQIEVNKENRTIKITDNGIGMTKEDLENNLLIWQAIADIEREEDLGNYEKAREYVYFFLEHAPVLHPLFEGTLLSESIFLDSLLGYASKRTDGFYEKIKKNKFLQNMAFFHRTSYAYFVLYQKDSEQAKRSLENWQQALKKISSPEEKAFEERQMAYLENILSANL